MIKKTIFGMVTLSVIVLTLVCTGTAFAQQRGQAAPASSSAGKKNALSLDLNYTLRGFMAWDSDAKTSYWSVAPGFEHLIAPRISIGAEFDLAFGKMSDVDILYFALGGFFRVYPLSDRGQMEGAFVGAGMGINMFQLDGKTKSKDGGFFGPYSAFRAGYKLQIDSIFIEPSFAYTYTKSSYTMFSGNNLGWSAALRFGVSF